MEAGEKYYWLRGYSGCLTFVSVVSLFVFCSISETEFISVPAPQIDMVKRLSFQEVKC